MADPTGIASFSRGWMESDPNKMLTGLLQGVIKIRGTNIVFSEAKTLIGGSSRGTFSKVSESLDYHFAKHGFEVGAQSFGGLHEKSGCLCVKFTRGSTNPARKRSNSIC